MPFEKIYAQQIRTFPPDLRDSSIQYGRLKKVIGRLVDELNDLGLSPETLGQIISGTDAEKLPILHVGLLADQLTLAKRPEVAVSFPVGCTPEGIIIPHQGAKYSKILYEVISDSGRLHPQLRISLTTSALAGAPPTTPTTVDKNGTEISRDDHNQCKVGIDSNHTDHKLYSSALATIGQSEKPMREFVIPLANDAAFFDLLEDNITCFVLQMEKIHSEFLTSVLDLAEMIGNTCQPATVAAGYKPYSSVLTHAGTVDVKNKRLKSDLYAWRDIFELFVESEVFEHISEGNMIDLSVEESRRRLTAFQDKVTKRWLPDKPSRLIDQPFGGRNKGDRSKFAPAEFKHKRSAEALQMFIRLNFRILEIRTVFQANIDATQKLVKKHTEHTALPICISFSEDVNALSIGPRSFCVPFSARPIHPRRFVQVVAEKLFPVVPIQDDYSCVICMNVAFKPIRLNCSHLFCVRCLVKMQKRGEDNCPMCRAHTVLSANARNVDWALLNFLEDWFPEEAREKLRADEKEVLDEQLREWRAGNDETLSRCNLM